MECAPVLRLCPNSFPIETIIQKMKERATISRSEPFEQISIFLHFFFPIPLRKSVGKEAVSFFLNDESMAPKSSRRTQKKNSKWDFETYLPLCCAHSFWVPPFSSPSPRIFPGGFFFPSTSKSSQLFPPIIPPGPTPAEVWLDPKGKGTDWKEKEKGNCWMGGEGGGVWAKYLSPFSKGRIVAICPFIPISFSQSNIPKSRIPFKLPQKMPTSSLKFMPSPLKFLLFIVLPLLLSLICLPNEANAKPTQHRHRRHHHHNHHRRSSDHFMFKDVLKNCSVPPECRAAVMKALVGQEQMPKCEQMNYLNVLFCLDRGEFYIGQ
jgi:hypothetical protein